MSKTWDAVVVGAGPNGLSAAAVLADAGLAVLVLERASEPGGGSRTQELTLPGFHHDVCSAIHPLGAASPLFRSLGLEKYGLRWLHPELPLAHPFDDGSAAVLHDSLEATAAHLGGHDGAAWTRLHAPFVRRWPVLLEETLRPVRIPRHPFLMAYFGLRGLRSCDGLVRSFFRDDRTRALFSGSAAHSIRSLRSMGTASFGLMLSIAGLAGGWPCAEGGSVSIAKALIKYVRARGGEIRTGHEVRSMADIPEARAVLFDVTPRQLLSIAGDAIGGRYRTQMSRFKYGPGVFKVDYALSGPIPWRSNECMRAGTVHVVGSYEELARAAEEVSNGRPPERPFVIMAQQSSVDPSRAPIGRHTGWAYCHVPHGSTVDMTARIEAQIERFAPGFRDLILARHTMNALDVEAHNTNMIGGDIGGGANHLSQFLFRPVLRWNPYTTSNPRLFLCSSSTPPGGGVHGMCGYWAAQTALARCFGGVRERRPVTPIEPPRHEQPSAML